MQADRIAGLGASVIAPVIAKLSTLAALAVVPLVGCSDSATSPAGSQAPAAASAATGSTAPASGGRSETTSATDPATRSSPAHTDTWIGRWPGPEGTYLDIAGGQGRYRLTIADLDGPKSFDGRGEGERIVFERAGSPETIRQSDGDATGMKWLAGLKDCLTIKAGEGYCRDWKP